MFLRIKVGLFALGIGTIIANCTPASTGPVVVDQAGVEVEQVAPAPTDDEIVNPIFPNIEVLQWAEVLAKAGPKLHLETDRPVAHADAVDQIDANLARLEALEVFEVGALIVDVPEEAYNCYGPCPGFETAEADALAASAQRLANLADIAEAAAVLPIEGNDCNPTTIDENLDALQALGIVTVGDLTMGDSQASSNCYSQAYIESAGQLAHIVEAAVEAFDVTVEAPEPNAAKADATEALENVDANLTRLEDLEIFEVGELIVNAPAEAFNCYGPCPGFETAEADAKAESAVRLAALVDIAEVAAGLPIDEKDCDAATIDANLEALEALGIVEVGDLMVVEPKTSANCYNLPCQEDIDEAEALNSERAGKLANIVTAAKAI
jgi:hypothetical protein